LNIGHIPAETILTDIRNQCRRYLRATKTVVLSGYICCCRGAHPTRGVATIISLLTSSVTVSAYF
ncbi:hypothetical protein QU816_27655, partial [Klebsiella pneumoniae]|uniref:hypothetical protein n=1 Tax=Klebsiella pneumoniae TaxID=573 RepID=UPI0022300532